MELPMFEVGGIFSIILLFLVIWALIHILGSDYSPGGKALWAVLVIVIPFIGFLIWLVAGPRKTA